MPDNSQPLGDDEPIDFRFQTFGELKRTFGPTRAASLLRAKEKKDRFGNGGLPALTEADIEIALKLLRGEKVGAQSGKALMAFKHFFASSDRYRAACETYLSGLQEGLPH